MLRRGLLLSGSVLGLAAGASRPTASHAAAPLDIAPLPGWRRFEVTTRVTLRNAPGAARLWIPLAQDAGGYQAVLAQRWNGTGQTAVLADNHYGAAILHSRWSDEAAGAETTGAETTGARTAGAETTAAEATDTRTTGLKTLEVVQVVATRDRDGASPLLPVTEAERRFWLLPTESVPTDGIVRDTAERITARIAEPRARLRAIYDWVVDNTSRNPDTPGCGLGDVRGMLESGNLGGKCADINGLMTGLARAAGFPARDVYGIRVGQGRWTPWLGADGGVSKAQHCRCEAYLDGVGWFPLDPADVRKVVLEQGLALGSAEVRSLRERLFGGWEGNWIGYNSATDVELPDASPDEKPNFAFLMYPCAITAAGQPDCLDASGFRYEITARELAA